MTNLELAGSLYLGFGFMVGVIGAAECLSQPRPVYRRSWFQWWLDAGICLGLVLPFITLAWPFYLFMRR